MRRNVVRVALIFAWAFELTPEGIKRESEVDRSQSITGTTGKKLNHTIIIILSIALGFMLVDKFVMQADEMAPAEEIVAAEFYAFVGDLDNAFKWLATGIEVRDPGAPWMPVSEFLVSAHGDPRWIETRERAGF